MQSLAVDSKRRRSTDVESERLLISTGVGRNDTPPREKTRIEVRSMLPPEKPQASQPKRKSLGDEPGKKRDVRVEEGSLQQRQEEVLLTHDSTRRSVKASKGHHKRSKTLDNVSDMSEPRRGSSSNTESPLGSSSRTSGSILNSSILSKVRQLVPIGRMDTTQTSYFRLKAMGIDPTTMSPSGIPASQARRKRARDDESEARLKKTPRLTPPENESSSRADLSGPSLARVNGHSSPEQQTRKPFTASVNDEDEQLFAQMRGVREAMSESISWFQDERAKSELSRSSSGEEAGKRVRARTFTSSRSRMEQRFARTGGHGLATKEVVKRSSTSEGKKPELGGLLDDAGAKRIVRRGFATISAEGGSFTSTRGIATGAASPAQGTSLEDAIEL